MYLKRFASFMCVAAMAVPVGLASSCLALGVAPGGKPQPATVSLPVPNDPPTGVSSSQPLPDAPGFGLGRPLASPIVSPTRSPGEKVSTRPFSAVAVAFKFGMGGVGFDVATPLGARLNLRGGASFLNISPDIAGDGITLNSNIMFRSVSSSVDFFPFGGSFRISPGLVLYNGNHLSAKASVPGGQSFELNNVKYYSSAAAPVSGTFDMTFGNKVAPSITVGFGNMIPHKVGQHWSVPVEVGFEYISAPSIALSLSGSACQGTYCAPIASDPTTQANLVAEQQDLNNDVTALRFYPIASVGLSYKFGASGSR